MRSVLILLLAIGVLAGTFPTASEIFGTFMKKYNKSYSSAEEQQYRQKVFYENIATAQKLNFGEEHEPFGVTKFMDLTPAEFKKFYLGYKPSTPRSRTHRLFGAKSEEYTNNYADTQFDWRSKGVVTPVKNQQQCGSCWAFSTTETIESAWAVKNVPKGKTIRILSEQQIVDCDNNDDGCGGGDTVTAYAYVQQAGGLEYEKDYPYTAQDGNCNFNAKYIGASITGFVYITQTQNENEMATKLLANGPLSICVDASSWQFYNGGVIKHNCGQNLDHCVQITGLNTTSGVPVWNIRNSWGRDWGEDGYLWVERGKNLCGVADEVTFPTIAA